MHFAMPDQTIVQRDPYEGEGVFDLPAGLRGGRGGSVRGGQSLQAHFPREVLGRMDSA
jgi:hypothetical protein